MKNKGDSIHEEYTMHGNIWIKTIIIIVLCVFSFIVLLPNVINGELFSLVLLITVSIINIYEFCRQCRNQGTMRINHLGIQIISWNGFCPSKKKEMKIYKWGEIKKIELQFFFNSYPKLYVLTTDNKKDKIEMFPYLTFYLNEKEFRKCFSRFCPQKRILYIS